MRLMYVTQWVSFLTLIKRGGGRSLALVKSRDSSKAKQSDGWVFGVTSAAAARGGAGTLYELLS